MLQAPCTTKCCPRRESNEQTCGGNAESDHANLHNDAEHRGQARNDELQRCAVVEPLFGDRRSIVSVELHFLRLAEEARPGLFIFQQGSAASAERSCIFSVLIHGTKWRARRLGCTRGTFLGTASTTEIPA